MLSTIFNKLMMDLKEKIRSYIFGAIRPILKKAILGIVGACLIIIGAVFALVSLVNFLSIYVSAWVAWSLIGLATLIIGGIMSVVALRR